MNFIRKNFHRIVFISFGVFLPIVSFAQILDPSTGTGGCPAGTLCNPIPSIGSVDGLIVKILEGALKIGIPIIALAIIYCGFLFVAARGKPEAIKKAKDALLYTLIGAAILLGAYAIALLISDTVLEL